jgi:hypothetical protein
LVTQWRRTARWSGGKLALARWRGGGGAHGSGGGLAVARWRGGGGAHDSSVPRGDETDGWEPGGDPTGIGAGGRVLLAQQIWVRSWGPAGIGFLI